MIEEGATVVEVRGDRAAVVPSGPSGCSGCRDRAGCGSAALARLFGRRRRTLWVRNPLAAAPGDQVVVGLEEGELLRAAWAAYVPPVAGMLVGALLGDRLAAPGLEELAALLSGLTGLTVGILWGARLSSRRGAQASIVRIVGPAVLTAGGSVRTGPVVSLEK